MAKLQVLICGLRNISDPVRVQKEPIESKTVHEALVLLSKRLGVEFVPQDQAGLRDFNVQSLSMLENGELRGSVGVMVERDGKYFFPRWNQDFLVFEDDVVNISMLAGGL